MVRMTVAIVIAVCISMSTEAAAVTDDFSALYKQLNRSVVTFRTMELVGDGARIQQQLALGSGILVNQQGAIMTAAHVVHTADTIIVEFADRQQIEAEVVTSNPASDLALIRLRRTPRNPVMARLGDSDSVEVGQSAPEWSVSLWHQLPTWKQTLQAAASEIEKLKRDTKNNK